LVAGSYGNRRKKVACVRIMEIGDETEEGTEEEVISVALWYIR
jgi:hypothetical protein